MSCALEKYTLAVAKRKSKDKYGRVNLCVLSQLEELDIPLLLEIIREQNKAIQKILSLGADSELLIETDADAMIQICEKVHETVDELAHTGSVSEFGDEEWQQTENGVIT